MMKGKKLTCKILLAVLLAAPYGIASATENIEIYDGSYGYLNKDTYWLVNKTLDGQNTNTITYTPSNSSTHYLYVGTGGEIINAPSLTVNQNLYINGAISDVGQVIVNGNINLPKNKNGELNVDEIIVKELQNNATGKVTAAKITASGKITNRGTITVTNGGSMETTDGDIANYGKIEAENAAVKAGGVFKNYAAGTVNAKALTATTNVLNYGKLTTGSIDTTNLTNYKDSEIEVSGQIKTSGNITNQGNMKAASIISNKITNNAGATLEVSGDVDAAFSNYGKVKIDGKLEYTGKNGSLLSSGNDSSFTANEVIAQASASTIISGSADIKTLTVKNGATIVDADGTQSKLNFDTINVESQIQFRSNTGDVKVGTVNLNKDDSLFQAGGTSMTITQLNVNANGAVETWGNWDNNGIIKDTAVTLTNVKVASGKKLSFTNHAGDKATIKAINMTLENGATLANRARWADTLKDYTEAVETVSIETLTATNASIYNEGTMKITTLKGENNTFYVESLTPPAQVSIEKNESTGLTVSGSGDLTDSFGDNITAGMQSLADTISIKNGNKQKMLKAAAGVVTGEITARTDENGNIISVREGVNAANAGISEMASIALMGWRAENNDMNKRLGELRDSKGEHGVWARMVRGEGKYKDIKNQYNTYQLGYDEKLSTNDKWTVGGAITYTDGESSFNLGRAENKHTGFAMYGSYLNDDGSFIDLIAKYARLEHEFDVMGGAGKGDYNTNGYSVSAEYGKRFTQDNGLWIEPQVELTYGKVGSVNYVTSNDVNVRQDGLESLVGRLGFALGKDFKQGNAYVRASYLYDFDGETNVYFSKGNGQRSFEQDLGGGWWEVGVGANINLSGATYLYFDVEKTYGGDVATPWQWNLGVRYSF